MRAFHYSDVGRYLHDSRESLGITVQQAATALHIRPKYITAIESGSLTELPGKAYIRGYIRNYVEYLHLNPEEVLDAYEASYAIKAREFFVPEPTLRENLPTRRILWWSLGGILALYSFWYFAMHDSAATPQMAIDVPAQFMQLLNKGPNSAMGGFWGHCASGEETVCFLASRSQAAVPQQRLPYDIHILNNPPQKP